MSFAATVVRERGTISLVTIARELSVTLARSMSVKYGDVNVTKKGAWLLEFLRRFYQLERSAFPNDVLLRLKTIS